MSQDNVEVVRRMHAVALQPGRVADFVAEFFDPEIEWHDSAAFPGAGVYQGHDALRRHIEDYLDAWTETKVEIEEIGPVGDRVVARIRYVGRGRESGVRLQDNGTTGIYEMRNGRILRVRQFVDEAEALEIAGRPTK
jgi:ketosteroid isomerase-like protein